MCPILTKIEKLRQKQKHLIGVHIKPETIYLSDYHSMQRMRSYCESWIFIEEQIQYILGYKK